MILTDFIALVNYNLRGTDDDPPVAGDEDWNYWATLANTKKTSMYRDTKKNWSSGWDDDREVGTIAIAARPTFTLDVGFMKPSNTVVIVKLDGTEQEIDIIEPQERTVRKFEAFIYGLEPQKLRLSQPIAAGSPYIGATVILPGYYVPADMNIADPNAVVPVDDPIWLAMEVAAMVAFNDITYEDKFADLKGMATELYKNMAAANNARPRGKAGTSVVNVTKISGY